MAVEFVGSMSLWSKQCPVFFLFLIILVAIHALVVFGIGRWRKIEIETLCVASQATVGGPSTALAWRSPRDGARSLPRRCSWESLATPRATT